MTAEERQKVAVDELIRGNIPDFLRTLHPVYLSYDGPDSQLLKATVWVMSDYLAIGSNHDFLRIPLSLHSALSVLSYYKGVPPTCKIVDAIYSQSNIHLKPQPLPPGSQMSSSLYYLRHQRMIEKQRGEQELGVLTAGHKKDVVISNRLINHSGRIAIYGWHRSNEDPIQPLSTVHREGYEDYSHGIRFVSQTVLINGKPKSLIDLLQDPKSAPLLSYEGSIQKIDKILHIN